jgi:hypothetical protein
VGSAQNAQTNLISSGAVPRESLASPSRGAATIETEVDDLDVSVVFPCLNEAACVADVVGQALAALEAGGLQGEVIVSDNGSVDGSPEIAEAAGARVVHAPLRGYGNAYHAGMAAARGRVLLMADADGTYPMDRIPDLVRPVLAGEADMVIGSRLQGTIHAMPWSHRYIGNPILTGILNRFFGVKVSDAHSGMRAIDAAAYRRLRLTTPGMEYASEMITQAARAHLRIDETPIEYHERVGETKLRTWHDGWRHLKFLLLASPNWLFLIPGALMLVLGAAITVPLAFGPVHIGGFQMILHPMFAGAVLVIVGFQLLQLGLLIRSCIEQPEGHHDPLAEFLHRRIGMEKMLLGGAALLVSGIGIGGWIAIHWAATGFGPLDATRAAIAAMTLVVLGTQTMFGAFVYAFFMPLQFGGGVGRPRSPWMVRPGRDDAG